jgi:hypothetical protein
MSLTTRYSAVDERGHRAVNMFALMRDALLVLIAAMLLVWL